MKIIKRVEHEMLKKKAFNFVASKKCIHTHRSMSTEKCYSLNDCILNIVLHYYEIFI